MLICSQRTFRSLYTHMTWVVMVSRNWLQAGAMERYFIYRVRH